MARPSVACASVMLSGESQRTTFGPAGVTIMPAAPGFYHEPKSIEDLVDFMVARILDHLGVQYDSANILEDAELRQGIKDFSNWPTIPQLYVKGEFIGGCDIVREMAEAGELQQLFQDKQVATA